MRLDLDAFARSRAVIVTESSRALVVTVTFPEYREARPRSEMTFNSFFPALIWARRLGVSESSVDRAAIVKVTRDR